MDSLRKSYEDWKKDLPKENKIKLDEIDKVLKKLNNIKDQQSVKLDAALKQEQNDVQTLKTRWEKIQFGDPTLVSKTHGKLFGELQELYERRTKLALKSIKTEEEDNRGETLLEGDTLNNILKKVYDFVDKEIVEQQRQEIREIFNTGGDQNKETENHVFEAELQQLQQVMSVRTYHSVNKKFMEERWPKLHPEYDICKNLIFNAQKSGNNPKTDGQKQSDNSTNQKGKEIEGQGNNKGLPSQQTHKESVKPENTFDDKIPFESWIQEYIEECVKVTYSMCTHDPKRKFGWKISAKHYKEIGAKVVTEQDLINNKNSLCIIVPAVIYRSHKGEEYLIQKGVIQSTNGTWL